MAAEIKQRFGIVAELVKGSGGIFEVTVDGDLVFSKKALHRFPDPGEVEAVIARRAASA